MITFKVGDKEQHEVSFSYDTTWGKVRILVDNKEYSSSRVMFIGHTPFILQVGEKEKHSIRIELDNPLFFAFRGSDIKVFVDEKLMRQDHIAGNMVVFILAMLVFFILLFSILLGIASH